MRSWYACAVGQCAHVNTSTSTLAFAKLLSVYVLPSTPGSENDGIGEPTASVGGCSEARAAEAQRISEQKADVRTNVRRSVDMICFPLREEDRAYGFFRYCGLDEAEI